MSMSVIIFTDMIVDFLQSRLVSDNIVVTKSFPKYCNAALSVVHELYTAPFQCSSPLFPLGITKIMIIPPIAAFIWLLFAKFAYPNQAL